MARVTTLQRIYLAAVGFLAITVGFWCYVNPAMSANGIPWTLPPLCATFLGSMYLSGFVFTVACIFSRQWGEIKLFMPQCALWTGGLALVSLLYIPAFDFSRNQTQLWWLAYIAYPLIALGFLWIHRRAPMLEAHEHDAIPQWMKKLLRAQGSVMIVLGLALLVAPGALQSVWAWHAGRMMLNLYSMPLLAYGLGSFLVAREMNLYAVRTSLLAYAIFFGAEIFASVRFASDLNGPGISVALWLGGFALAALSSICLTYFAFRRTHVMQVTKNVRHPFVLRV